MIPDLDDNVLPEGLHDCTLDEIAQRFGKFQRSDRRPQLMERLRAYAAEARRSGSAIALIVDGSFVTAKTDPTDIDLVLVLPRNFDFTAELMPIEYNVQSKRYVTRRFGFDVLPAAEGSETYERHVSFFSRVKLGDPGVQTAKTRKGLLRVIL